MNGLNIIFLIVILSTSLIFSQDIIFTHFTEENSPLPSENIYDILHTEGDITWIATHFGLVKIENGLWTIYDDQNSPLPPYIITSLEISNDGLLWVGTSNGLFSFDGNSWSIFDTTNSDLPANHIRDLEIDIENNLWVSSWDVPNGGLSSLIDGVWENFNSDNSDLPHNYVTTIKSDLDTSIWIGSGLKLIHIENETWNFFTPENSALTGSIVNCIDFDSLGNKWIANEAFPHWPSGITEGALICHHDTEWASYNYNDWEIAGNNNSVQSVGVGKKNIVWFGIGFQDPGDIYNNWGMGLMRMQDSSWTHYSANSSQLVDNEIKVIAFDQIDRIWVGTRHGITVIDDPTITSIPTQKIAIIKSFGLYQNYPNPFNPSTKITYSLPQASNVELKIYSSLGEEIGVLINKFQQTGEYEVEFFANSGLASGIYIAQMVSGNFRKTIKMLLIR